VRDSWTGEISKFSVNTKLADTFLFFSPQDVVEATDIHIKLNVAFNEINSSIEYGARVIDVNGKVIGKVDYTIEDSLTGEVTRFKVAPDIPGDDIFFSREDVAAANPSEIRLKVSFSRVKQ